MIPCGGEVPYLLHHDCTYCTTIIFMKVFDREVYLVAQTKELV